MLCEDNELVFYAYDADIPVQNSLELILKDDSLNWCTTTYKSG